jgi:hypothetical protein
MIELVPEMIYRLRSVGPLPQTDGSPTGARQFWQMSDAELEGPRIRARAPYVGGDWMRVGPDGLGRPDVRVQFVTDDKQVVLLHYTGLVRATEAFNRAAESNGTTNFADQTRDLSDLGSRRGAPRASPLRLRYGSGTFGTTYTFFKSSTYSVCSALIVSNSRFTVAR